MKSWEVEEMIKGLRHMSSKETLEISSRLTTESLQILRELVRKHHPQYNPHRVREHMKWVLWHLRPYVAKKSPRFWPTSRQYKEFWQFAFPTFDQRLKWIRKYLQKSRKLGGN